MLEGLRGVLSIEDLLHAKMREEGRERKQSRYRRVKKRKAFFRKSCCTWISQHKVQEHTCVHISDRTEPLTCAKSTVKCTNRVAVRSFSFELHTHIVSQKRVMQQPRAWTWDDEWIATLTTWHCAPSVFTCPISGCSSNVGAWNRTIAARA